MSNQALVVSIVLLNNIWVITRKLMNIDTFRILITLGSSCYEIFCSWQYYTLIDWYEGNSEFIVPRDTNYIPRRSQGQLLMSRGTTNLLLCKYPVNRCFIIPNSIRDHILHYHGQTQKLLAMPFLVVCGFRDFCFA